MKKLISAVIVTILVLSCTALAASAETDAECMAKLIYGEAGGVASTTQKAAVAWVVLNRMDDPRFPNTIQGVIKARGQFAGYRYNNPVRQDCLTIAQDVMWRYTIEKQGVVDCGRIIPNNYFYFTGDGVRNYFRQEYRSRWYWNWSLPSPYVN